MTNVIDNNVTTSVRFKQLTCEQCVGAYYMLQLHYTNNKVKHGFIGKIAAVLSVDQSTVPRLWVIIEADIIDRT